jgi:hypothetical protein
MRVYVVRKWLLWGRRHFVCWNITRVSLWLLCNLHFVQSTQRTRLRDVAYLKARVIAAVKNIDALMLTYVWKELEYQYRCVPCHPWCTNKTSLVVKKKKKTSVFSVAVNNSIKVGPLVFLL